MNFGKRREAHLDEEKNRIQKAERKRKSEKPNSFDWERERERERKRDARLWGIERVFIGKKKERKEMYTCPYACK